MPIARNDRESTAFSVLCFFLTAFQAHANEFRVVSFSIRYSYVLRVLLWINHDFLPVYLFHLLQVGNDIPRAKEVQIHPAETLSSHCGHFYPSFTGRFTGYFKHQRLWNTIPANRSVRDRFHERFKRTRVRTSITNKQPN